MIRCLRPSTAALALTAAAHLMFCGITSAQITAFWRQNPITPQAVASDPALVNMQSWSLRVTTTGDWAGAALVGVLPQFRTFYNPAAGGNTRPSTATVAAHPHVEFDTYFTAPSDQGGGVGAPVDTGRNIGAGSSDFGGTTGTFDASWVTLLVDPPGTYEIVRWTFPADVIPVISPAHSRTSQFNPDSSVLIPPIPEPALVALLATVALLMRRAPRRVAASAALALGLIVVPMASAQITAFWRHNPITPQAIAADPALASMQSWSIMATTTGNWASAGLEAILPVGLTFYNPPFSGSTRPNPPLVSAFPYLAFDTYITAPSDIGTASAPKIFGSFPNSGPGTADFGGTSGRFSVSWGDLVTDPPGTYEIARLTFPLVAVPEVRNLTPDPATTSPSFLAQSAPDYTTIIPDIPEPAAWAVGVGVGLIAFCRRSRRRAAAGRACAVALLASILVPMLPLCASAQISAVWRQNPITPQAIASDPVLSEMQSWSLMITTTGNWAVAGMLARLPAGHVFYNPTAGGRTKPSPATIANFPHVAFDTYVTCPGDNGVTGAPAILGGWPQFPLNGDFGETTGEFSVTWGDLAVDPPGTFEIARLTFPAGTLPHMPTTPYPGLTSQVNPDATTAIPSIPEPAALPLIVLAAAVWLRRRARLCTGAVAVVCTVAFSAPVASAQITAFWRQNSITPQAVASDPALANMQSWSIMATTTGDWASGGLNAVLPAGRVFYNSPPGMHTKPSAAAIAMFPHVEFDTYVSSPGDLGGGVGAPVLLGMHAGAPGPAVLEGNWISAAWGNLTVDPPGTFEIARLTFPLDASLTLGGPMQSLTSQVNPDADTFIPQIPEPSTGPLMLACAYATLRRRR